MDNSPFVWVGLGLMALIAIGYAVGHAFNLQPRQGPTPIGEIVGICGAAAVGAMVLGYPIALVPIGIAAVVMFVERFR